MFNLSSFRQFKGSKDAGLSGVWCYGPSFKANGGHPELNSFAPFNGDNKCESWANEPGYDIGKNFLTGISKLTNQMDRSYFTITELEVWGFVNVENLMFS